VRVSAEWKMTSLLLGVLDVLDLSWILMEYLDSYIGIEVKYGNYFTYNSAKI